MTENTSGTMSPEPTPGGRAGSPPAMQPSGTAASKVGMSVAAAVGLLFVIGLAIGYLARPNWSRPSAVQDYFVSVAHLSRPGSVTPAIVNGVATAPQSPPRTSDQPLISIQCESYAMTYDARNDSLYPGVGPAEGFARRWHIRRQGVESRVTQTGGAILAFVGVRSVLGTARQVGLNVWEYTSDLARGSNTEKLAILAAIAVLPVAAGVVLSYDGQPDCDSESVKHIFKSKEFYQNLVRGLRSDEQGFVPLRH